MINFEKRDWVLLTLVFVLITGIGFVLAYGGSDPTVMGHSSGELSGVPSHTHSLTTTVVVGSGKNGSHFIYDIVYCPSGYTLTGCSGHFNTYCPPSFGDNGCAYMGAYAYGNGCSAMAHGYTRTPNTNIVRAYAYCIRNSI